ncbi:ThiF family adenylyltransferase [Natronoglomus mannanivorans]|uniref:ThiF family adenylyltransferase n=1 Tax=Natronoglomus mannanivorans TaxID=2979990 RepID=A0AAP2Z4H4_9EURY|nr:ThiF family adenylyltransferase [Halobacteria archaeon AArc-xg1-1]
MAETITTHTTDEFTLVLTASQVQELRDWLLQEDGNERFAYVYCTESDGQLLATEIDRVPAEDCEVQEAHAVRPKLSVERDRMGAALEAGLVPIMLHSHPFSDRPTFSSLDDDIMESYREWIGGLYPDSPLCFGVVGHEGMDTAIYVDPGSEERSKLPVEVVGEWTLDVPLEAPTEPSAVAIDEGRYDRSIRALTEDGQARIADATVAVAGLGGLGSIVVTQLARVGVRDFVFVDPDTVERSNLPRIYGATEADVGRPKVDVVGEHVVRANPEATVDAYESRVQDVPEDALASCDVLIGAVDRLSARLYCSEFAVRHLRYYVDAGVAIQTTDEGEITEERGLIQLVAPGVTGCLDCLGRNDPELLRLESMGDDEIQADVDRGYLDEDISTPEPAITPLNAFAATVVTRMFTKLVTGYERPADYVYLEGVANELVSVGTHPSNECITCGPDGVLGEGVETVDEDHLAGGDAVELDVDLESLGNTKVDNRIPSRTITADSVAEHRTGDPAPSDESALSSSPLEDDELGQTSTTEPGRWHSPEQPRAGSEMSALREDDTDPASTEDSRSNEFEAESDGPTADPNPPEETVGSTRVTGRTDAMGHPRNSSEPSVEVTARTCALSIAIAGVGFVVLRRLLDR